jgi:hypothetical protein
MMHLAPRLQLRRSPLGHGPVPGVFVAFFVRVLYNLPLVPPTRPRRHILWATTPRPSWVRMSAEQSPNQEGH